MVLMLVIFFLRSFDGGEENTLLNFLMYLEIANI